MSAEYARAIATALRLIKKKGVVCTWTVETPQPNAGRPWNPLATTPTAYQVPIVFLPTMMLGEAFAHFLKGTEIPRGAELALMGAVPFAPSLGDRITRLGKQLQIKTLDLVAPAGEPVLWSMGVVA